MDILEILTKHGITVSEDRLQELNRDLRKNYKHFNEVKKIKAARTLIEAQYQEINKQYQFLKEIMKEVNQYIEIMEKVSKNINLH